MKKILVILIIWVKTMLPAMAIALAQEQPATPEIQLQSDARLLISEINFKNKDQDWVEIYYFSPTSQSLNLKGLTFQDDKNFKILNEDFTVKSGEFVVLTFKSSSSDDQTNRKLFSPQNGLTGTTEQFIIKDQKNTIFDAVCWSSKKPTEDEKKDLQELFEAEEWISADPLSCIESEKITSNQSIVRRDLTEDSNTKNDWDITDDVTPGKANEELIETTKPADTIIEKTQTPSNPSVVSKSTPAASTEKKASTKTTAQKSSTKKTTTASKPKKSPKATQAKKTTANTAKNSSAKKSKKTYQNGDLSKNILINEIFAHAQKDDAHKEWIELYNQGEEDINLGNWRLDDEEGGSKPFIISDETTIKAGDFLVIEVQTSKLSLNNKKDEVRLFDYNEEQIDIVIYEEAPAEESYSQVILHKEDGSNEKKWRWEKTPTPGAPNPDSEEFHGIIESDPHFKESYSFTFKDTKGQQKTIVFDENLLAGPLAKATFIKGAEARIEVTKDPEKPGTYLLKSYEILSSPEQESTGSSTLLGMLIFGGMAIGGGIWMFKRKWPKKNEQDIIDV